MKSLRSICFVLALGVPTTCSAQRVEDAATVTTINEALKKKTLLVVEQQARAGDAEAQLQLALGYAVGGILPKDEKLAAKWCRRAARRRNTAAETTMGYLYSSGKGVPQSDSKAIDWWRRAADQGSADAEFNLGEFYSLGRGVKRDYREAVKWFLKAAKQGEPDAQYHLGLIYETGSGVDRDLAEALRWYRLSAAQGFPDARERMDAFAKLVPPQHEFSLGENSKLSIDEGLQKMAQDHPDQATDRAVLDDIAFPADEKEYLALGKHAVLLLAAVTHDPAELPLARVYLESENGAIELRKIGSFLCRTPAGSIVENKLGPYRENAFYLLPISAYFQPAKLLIDFARNRTGFLLIKFPEDVKLDFVLADSERALETNTAISLDTVNDFVLREYGFDIKAGSKPEANSVNR